MSDRATTPVRRHGVHPGRLLFGLALAALGVLWLLGPYAGPVAAGLIAWMWLGETLSTGQAIGAALIVSGILLAESATSLQISH